MVNEDEYDYSATRPFLEPLTFWPGPDPFITEMEALYGTLWQFKSVIDSWTFGVNRFKDYVFLRHKVKGTGMYVTWNVKEKVALIEYHQKEYVVITLQAIDDKGEECRHTHSIVCHEEDDRAVFDFQELIRSLQEGGKDALATEISSQFSPWVKNDAGSMARRINLLFRKLEKHAMLNVEKPNPSIRQSS